MRSEYFKLTITATKGNQHIETFSDPECGSSLWRLAVDHQANAPGVGEALGRQVVDHYRARGRRMASVSQRA